MNHIFTTPMQPATNFVVDTDEKPMRFRCSKRATFWCRRCRKRRWASKMFVQVFYDDIRYWCKDEKCNRK